MEKYTLKNGIIVYYYPVNNAHSTSIGLYINSGSANEPLDKNGITHLLEHLHFRHLEEMSQNELYIAMDKIGANLRAMTHKECMRFYLKVRPVFFTKAIGLFKRIITMYDWTDEDLELEKKVVLNELASKDSCVYAETIMDDTIWEGHPLCMPILGTRESIDSLTIKDVVEYKKSIFSVGNIALVITGIITECMKQDILTILGEITLSESGSKCENILIKTYKTGPNIKLLPYQWDYVDINISFNARNHPNLCELMILNSILGGGTGAKLQCSLREELTLTSDIYSYLESYSAGSNIRISLTTHKGRIYDCIKAITDVVNKLKFEITNEDMETNLPYFTENLWYWLEDTELLNSEIGWEVFGKEKPRTIEERINEYQHITREKLMCLSKKVFIPENVSLLVLGSVDNITQKRLTQTLLGLRTGCQGDGMSRGRFC